MSYVFVEHTGDTAVEIRCRTATEVFEEAARALGTLYVDSSAGDPVLARREVVREVRAEDAESLLVDLLNDLIYVFDTTGFVVARAEALELDLQAEPRIRIRLEGEEVDLARHCVVSEVKAATFHGVAVEQGPDGWRARVVFDL